jgi:hypothetical protein
MLVSIDKSRANFQLIFLTNTFLLLNFDVKMYPKFLLDMITLCCKNGLESRVKVELVVNF